MQQVLAVVGIRHVPNILSALRTGHGWYPGTGGRVLGSLGKEGRSLRAGLRRAGLGELP